MRPGLPRSSGMASGPLPGEESRPGFRAVAVARGAASPRRGPVPAGVNRRDHPRRDLRRRVRRRGIGRRRASGRGGEGRVAGLRRAHPGGRGPRGRVASTRRRLGRRIAPPTASRSARGRGWTTSGCGASRRRSRTISGPGWSGRDTRSSSGGTWCRSRSAGANTFRSPSTRSRSNISGNSPSEAASAYRGRPVLGRSPSGGCDVTSPDRRDSRPACRAVVQPGRERAGHAQG